MSNWLQFGCVCPYLAIKFYIQHTLTSHCACNISASVQGIISKLQLMIFLVEFCFLTFLCIFWGVICITPFGDTVLLFLALTPNKKVFEYFFFGRYQELNIKSNMVIKEYSKVNELHGRHGGC